MLTNLTIIVTKPTVQAATAAGGIIGGISSLLGVLNPWLGMLTILIGLLSAGVGLYYKFKTDRVKLEIAEEELKNLKDKR